MRNAVTITQQLLITIKEEKIWGVRERESDRRFFNNIFYNNNNNYNQTHESIAALLRTCCCSTCFCSSFLFLLSLFFPKSTWAYIAFPGSISSLDSPSWGVPLRGSMGLDLGSEWGWDPVREWARESERDWGLWASSDFLRTCSMLGSFISAYMLTGPMLLGGVVTVLLGGVVVGVSFGLGIVL